jgi:RNA polymerase sigma-70 factor (ECF subfamily)
MSKHHAEDSVEEWNDTEQLLAALRAGDPLASGEFYRRFGPFVRAAVRRQLNEGLRSRFDSLDFVQDVWASFLAIPPEKYTFASAQGLLGFLTKVAHNKVIEVFRQRYGTQKYDIGREQPLGVQAEDEPRSSNATPSQWAIAGEQWEQLLSRVPPGYRAIVERLREGHNNEDIARMTNVSLSTVNRVIRRLKELTGL